MVFLLKYAKKSSILVLLLLFLGVIINAQDLDTYKKKYGSYNEVYTLLEKEYTFKLKKGSLEIDSWETSEKMVVSDPQNVAIKDQFVSSTFYKLTNKEAKTILPTGKQLKDSNFKVVKDFDLSYAFHDDMEIDEFEYPGLEVGAKKVKYYSYSYSDPHMLDDFHLLKASPVDKVRLVINVDKGIDLGYKVFNAPDNLIFKKEEGRNRDVYIWEAREINPLPPEGNSKGYLHYAPHIEVFVKSYTDEKGNKKNVLSSLDDLHSLYTRYLEGIQGEDHKTLKKIVEGVVSDQDSEEQKVKKIYKWVQNNIKYIAFEAGYEGFIPRSANTTLNNRYGDCKDMANIIQNMSTLAGVKNVHLAWIGTREKPYSYYELHTPAVDNHMIAAYKSPNGYVFLDATSEFTQYGSPSAFIQGKEALVHLETNDYEVVKIPELSPKQNLVEDKIEIQLSQGEIVGSGELHATGYNREYLLAYLREKKGEEKIQEAKSFVSKGNNKFILKTFEQNSKSDDTNYYADYTFSLDDYTVALDNELYINLFMEKPLGTDFIPKDRKLDKTNRYNQRLSYQVFLDTSGYEVTYLPENASFDNELLSFSATFKKSDKGITLEYVLDEKALVIAPSQFETYNKSIKKLKKIYNQSVGLKKK